MTAWLLIGVTFAVLWTLWGFFNFVADLFDRHRKPQLPQAGRTRPRHKEKERSW